MRLVKATGRGPSDIGRIVVALGITFGFVLPLALLGLVFVAGGVTPEGHVPPWFGWSALGTSVVGMLLLAIYAARKGWQD